MTTSPPAATSTTDEPTPSDPAATATPDEPTLSDTAATAVADLAERLGVEPADVEVVAEEEVTWSDGSLGCAEPGGMYTQALVDGSRITLRAGGIDYHYHSGGSPEPFLCEQPTE